MPSGAVYKDVSCAICGRVFSGGPNARFCPTCREDRLRAQSIEYHRRYRRGDTRKVGSTEICPDCSKEYTIINGAQYRCLQCSWDARRLKVRAYTAAKRARKKRPG